MYLGIGSPTLLSHVFRSLLSVCSPFSCPLFSLSTSLSAAAQPCNQLIVHEGARTKAGKFRLTRQREPEPIISALGLSCGLMACDRLFLTDSVTNFSILDGDFWTLGSCHTAESHDPIDQSAFWWQSFQQWSFQTRGYDYIIPASLFSLSTTVRALRSKETSNMSRSPTKIVVWNNIMLHWSATSRYNLWHFYYEAPSWSSNSNSKHQSRNWKQNLENVSLLNWTFADLWNVFISCHIWFFWMSAVYQILLCWLYWDQKYKQGL